MPKGKTKGKGSKKLGTGRGSKASKAAELRALKAVTIMRKGASRQKASRRAKTSPRTIQKYAGDVVQARHGHYEATPSDRKVRRMRVPTEQGLMVAELQGSRSASRLSRYWSAVDHFLKYGDQSRLKPFEGKRLRAKGQYVEFITDPHLLSRLGDVGEVRFEDLYESTM